jgi:hypothetical protein
MGLFRRSMPKLGFVLLAALLIAGGLRAIIPSLDFSGCGTVLAILAIAAGVLILLER